jgi:hypothetical protein
VRLYCTVYKYSTSLLCAQPKYRHSIQTIYKAKLAISLTFFVSSKWSNWHWGAVDRVLDSQVWTQGLPEVRPTDTLQYRLRFGSLCYIRTVFRLNCLTAQLSYEGRAAVEGAKYSSIYKFDHHNINGGAVDDTWRHRRTTCKLNLVMRYLWCDLAPPFRVHVPSSLDKKAEEDATFCLVKVATFFPLYVV